MSAERLVLQTTAPLAETLGLIQPPSQQQGKPAEREAALVVWLIMPLLLMLLAVLPGMVGVLLVTVIGQAALGTLVGKGEEIM